MNESQEVARIGPNAILQVVATLDHRLGPAETTRLVEVANLGRYRDAPPTSMVDERDVIALHDTVRRTLAPELAREVMLEAGLRTGDYLLGHRIPRTAQALLRVLPARLASRVLIGAISRHTWTFAGSGDCRFDVGHPVVITIADCPICRGAHAAAPLCDYYAATFERLYRTLVHARARVRETGCLANGGDCCRFEIRWD